MPRNMSQEELENTAREYRRTTGENVTPEEIAAVAANYDEDAAVAAERENYETKLWDKTSDINGVNAQDVLLARDDIPEGGEVYLVVDKRSGDVVFFQPFAPGDEGVRKITKSTWETVSSDHLNSIVTQKATERFMIDLPSQLEDIRNPRGSKA